MDVLSLTTNSIRLHKSASDLSIVCEQKNVQQGDVSVNFALLPNSSFLKFWRQTKSKEFDSSFELWRVKKKDDDTKYFENMNKHVLSGLSALGTSKKSPNPTTFALGFTNGKIKIRQFSKDLKVIHEFQPSKTTSSSIIFLDYNSSNENLASTYDNGLVNIYSLQTSVKFDTLKLDNGSTLARFHPSKKTHLAIASYQGMVTLYDIFAKKIIFKETTAHSAPCSDVVFSDSFLLSSGYDGIVNIFDIRKQKVSLKIKGNYGWTTLAMSNCGAYFVGGNMKGELISYDMRNIKKPLTSCRAESGNYKISRAGFLNPTSTTSDESPSQIEISNTIRNSLAKVEQEIQSKSPVPDNDSFIEDIVNFNRGRISDFSSSAISHGTHVTTPSRNSNKFEDDFPDINEIDDSNVTKTRRVTNTKDKRRSSILLPSTLQHIHEEKENDSKVLNCPKKSDEVEPDESFKSATAETQPLPSTFDFRKEFDNLKSFITDQIHTEVGMLNFDENFRFSQVMWHVSEQRLKLQERVNMIEECMAMLMSDDFKINRILELQNENEELKKQNLDLMRRMSQ